MRQDVQIRSRELPSNRRDVAPSFREKLVEQTAKTLLWVASRGPFKGSRVAIFACSLLLVGLSGIGAPKEVTNTLKDLKLPGLAATLEPPTAFADTADQELAKLNNKVDKAISKGAKWLSSKSRKLQSENRRNPKFAPEAAFYAMVLAKCDPEKHKVRITKLLEFAEKHLYREGRSSQTHFSSIHNANYGISCILMCYEAIYASSARQFRAPELPRDVKLKVQRLASWLVSSQSSHSRSPGGFGYGDKENNFGDISNTQFSALALRASIRLGVEIPTKVFTKLAEYICSMKGRPGALVEGPLVSRNRTNSVITGEHEHVAEASGTKPIQSYGFYYQKAGNALTAANACAGVVVASICKEALRRKNALTPELTEKLDTCISGGLAWMKSSYSITDNPGERLDSQKHYYYLYGLERMCRINQIELIGDHNWWIEGAELLTEKDRRNRSGAWIEGVSDTPLDAGHHYQTAFALLFLNRSTHPSNLPLLPPVTLASR